MLSGINTQLAWYFSRALPRRGELGSVLGPDHAAKTHLWCRGGVYPRPRPGQAPGNRGRGYHPYPYETNRPGAVDLALLVGFEPVRAAADGDVERDVELQGALHLGADHGLQAIHFVGWGLEDQLVVDLQQHP